MIVIAQFPRQEILGKSENKFKSSNNLFFGGYPCDIFNVRLIKLGKGLN